MSNIQASSDRPQGQIRDSGLTTTEATRPASNRTGPVHNQYNLAPPGIPDQTIHNFDRLKCDLDDIDQMAINGNLTPTLKTQADASSKYMIRYLHAKAEYLQGRINWEILEQEKAREMTKNIDRGLTRASQDVGTLTNTAGVQQKKIMAQHKAYIDYIRNDIEQSVAGGIASKKEAFELLKARGVREDAIERVLEEVEESVKAARPGQ
ncbi:hypothetical protein PMZ80_006769 [Knufia obscura]|uniref:Uncharacterized protein n=1 Tax=Knufia obscura TaxID=1635080 RepID=A0ABR0RLJ9_9EURO|nr:hypothetical protein PMZ80_006769 [Knufia obscura]